jgi:xanthine/uracil permease
VDKLTAFMDAYHAPYVTKNRYWTGLLLLARVVLYLTAAINVSGEPRFNLLAVSLIIGSLFLLQAYSEMSVYKQWVLNVLEFTTYTSIFLHWQLLHFMFYKSMVMVLQSLWYTLIEAVTLNWDCTFH